MKKIAIIDATKQLAHLGVLEVLFKEWKHANNLLETEDLYFGIPIPEYIDSIELITNSLAKAFNLEPIFVEFDPIEICVGTNCECTFCPACAIAYFDVQKCAECGRATTYSNECFDCQPWDYLEETFDAWVTRTNANYLEIVSENRGWRGLGGTACIESLFSDFKNSLTINGEYNLYATFNYDSIVVKRTSHDEMGAVFTYKKCDSIE